MIIRCRCALNTTAVLFMLIVLSGCRQSNFQYDQQIGVANIQGEKNEACLAIANPSIKPGSKLTLVAAGEEPMVGTATAAELLPKDCDNSHLSSTELSNSGPTFYRIRTDEQWKNGGYAFAILQPSGPVTISGKKIEGDLDGDGTKESFRECASAEGVHYQVWSGEPFSGRPRWHWYIYAGYDLEPTCTEKEYFGPK